MRYQLPIYPGLTIFAGWAVIQLWDSASALTRSKRNLQRSVPLVVGGAVLLLTFLYAVAFTGLYLKPITRLAASRWIYQNIPGPVNLRIQSQEGEYNQPLPFPYEHTLVSGEPFSIAFEAKVDGLLDQIYLGHVENQGFATDPVSLNLQVSSLSDPGEILTQGTVTADLASGTDDRGPGVLENPTCRWSQRICAAKRVDCAKPKTIGDGLAGCCAPEHRPVIQERAWTSPIWVQPE